MSVTNKLIIFTNSILTIFLIEKKKETRSSQCDNISMGVINESIQFNPAIENWKCELNTLN